ncbi:hypothetical protein [Bradyrhizobium sp. SEMIA]|nr:hypothetical protein [Bradyrhizobium sp. SEMIA]QOG21801.1 hypothetical protein FOM02_35455 [Bradyrhizobium sp. SEMIA]
MQIARVVVDAVGAQEQRHRLNVQGADRIRREVGVALFKFCRAVRK